MSKCRDFKVGDILRVTKMFNIASGMKFDEGLSFRIVHRSSFGRGHYPTVFYQLEAIDKASVSFEMVDIIVSFMEH